MNINSEVRGIKRTNAAVLTAFAVLVVLVSAFSPCFAADSPQYILNLYAADPADATLTPISPVVNPTANVAVVGLVVTTMVPSNLTVDDSGFNMWTVGYPKVVVTTTARTVTTQQNPNGSTTTKYTFNLSVPDVVYSTYLAFSFWSKIYDIEGQPPVTHESEQLQFQLLGVTTPTPVPTPPPTPVPTTPPTTRPTASPTPTPTPNPTPTQEPTPLPSEIAIPTPTPTGDPLAVEIYYLPLIISLIIIIIIVIIAILLWLIFRRRHANTR